MPSAEVEKEVDKRAVMAVRVVCVFAALFLLFSLSSAFVLSFLKTGRAGTTDLQTLLLEEEEASESRSRNDLIGGMYNRYRSVYELYWTRGKRREEREERRSERHYVKGECKQRGEGEKYLLMSHRNGGFNNEVHHPHLFLSSLSLLSLID